ncbi:MAG: hypothetical protein AAF569_04850 [Pseudomonadota bacterium]
MSAVKKKKLDAEFSVFKRKLNMVGKFEPREEYLYPLMKTVSYRDAETALDLTIMRYGEKVDQALREKGATIEKEIDENGTE